MRPTCPFCHAPIADALALHGGPCPSCFAEIPGEESATDPGEDVKAKQAAADREVAARKARVPLLLGAPVVLALLAGLGWALMPSGEMEELRFEAEDFNFEIDLVNAPPEPEAAVEAPASRGTAATAGRPARAGTAHDGAEARTERPATGGTAEASERGTTGVAGLATAGGSSTASGGLVSFDAQRTAAVLESRDDIQAAIGQLFRARQPRLRQCFERALKGNPELGGHWRLSFTIVEDGTVRDAGAAGVQMADAAFEGCLVDEMKGWQLRGRLDKPWPVSFAVKFEGQEG